jgi:hypothetical protein
MKGPGAVNELNDPVQKELNEEFFVSDVKKIYLPFSKGKRLLVSIKGSGEKRP